MAYKTPIIIMLLFASVVMVWFFSRHKPACQENGNIITVGTNAEYPPFSFTKDGEVVGLDIDIAQEICKRLQKQMQLKDMSFEALIPQAQIGSIHLIAAGITPTADRAQQLLFTEPYFSGDSLYIVTKIESEPITQVSQLQGKSIVVNEGFTADFYISKMGNLSLTRLPTMIDAFLAIRAGHADVFVTSYQALKPLFEVYNKDDFRLTLIPDTQETYAIGISKKHAYLLEPVQNILVAMQEDGTLDQLMQKWKLHD